MPNVIAKAPEVPSLDDLGLDDASGGGVETATAVTVADGWTVLAELLLGRTAVLVVVCCCKSVDKDTLAVRTVSVGLGIETRPGPVVILALLLFRRN